MINLTKKAKNKINNLLNLEDNKNNKFLRVAIKSGGCSGLSYDLSFDNELKDIDKEFIIEGIKIVIDVKSLMYLMDMTLDFSDGINGKGFEFSNPNAMRTCGCGESFSF
jgi:iron-sulfur cluster assembly protein